MEQRVKNLENLVEQLVNHIDSLESVATFPREVQTAIEGRVGGFRTSTSNKTTASESQSVNEGGSASYSVQKVADGYRAHVIEGGVTVYIPIYIS